MSMTVRLACFMANLELDSLSFKGMGCHLEKVSTKFIYAECFQIVPLGLQFIFSYSFLK